MKAATVGRATKKDTSMDHSEVSKILVYLKYHKTKAGSDADAAPFTEALRKYGSLPASEKKTFLSKFQKNKKDWSWTQTLRECRRGVHAEGGLNLWLFQPIRDREDERIRAQFDTAGLDSRVFLT